jgi:glucose-1-phosphate thymidylyltransferase
MSVANRPLVCHVVNALAAVGVAEVAVVGPESVRDRFADAASAAPDGVSVSYFARGAEGGLVTSLAAVDEFLDEESFVLQRGDGLLLDDFGPLIGELDEDRADALLLVHRVGADAVPTMLGGSRDLLPLVGDGVTAGPGFAMAGAHLFGGRFMQTLRPMLRSGDALQPGWLAETARRAGARAEVRVIRGWRWCAGGPRDVLALNRLVLDALPPAVPSSDAPEGCIIEGRVEIDPSALVQSSVIRGPAVIGPRARIVEAYVGPYTAIGEDVTLENAEIEHSVVLAGATVRHVGTRIESSVLGRRARVERDFSLPRSLRVHLADGAEVVLR